MKLVGCMPVRNEEWCLGLSARVALMWCDELVILWHTGLTDKADNTGDILKALAGEYRERLVLLTVTGEWDEMQHRQFMLEAARREGATHIAIIDADEILTGNLISSRGAGQSYGFRFEFVPPGVGHILQLPGYNLRNGINQYHSNGIWGKRWFSTAFRDDPALHWAGDRFHHREPMGKTLANYRPIAQGQGGVMHLWGASERRLKAKHALYKLTDRIRFPEKPIATIEKEFSWAIKGEAGHSQYGTPETWTYNAIPEAWWQPYQQWMKYLDVDAEPWQIKECRRLIETHGSEIYRGLDLFGVS